jgi:anti-sigma B factor antagonist
VEIDVKNMKRCHLVSVSGRVDSATAPDLEEKLLELVASGNGNLVIDLSQVGYISSAGLKALLHAQIRAREKFPQGEVKLSEVPAKLRETLELVGLHHVFKILDDTTEAVGSF